MKYRLTAWVTAACLVSMSANAALVAHYDFSDGDLLDNEVAGGVAFVNAGPSNVVLGAGTAVFTSEPNQNTASDNYLSADIADLSTFTLSFWLRTDVVDQNAPYSGIFSSAAPSTTTSWQLFSAGATATSQPNNDGRLALTSGTTGNRVDTSVGANLHTSNVWYHIAATYNGDGVLRLTVSPEGGTLGGLIDSHAHAAVVSLEQLVFGSNRALNQTYGMELANIRVYDDTTISLPALFAEGPGTTSALIAHYVFDDGDLFDNETGNAFTLSQQTAGTGSTNVTLGAIGAVGTAAFPGGHTDDGPIAWLQADANLAPDDFTVSFWFQTDTVDQGNDYRGLFSSGYSGVQAGTWQIHSDGDGGAPNGGELCARFNGNTTSFNGAPLHTADTWHHVVVRKDNAAAQHTKLYLTSITNEAVASPIFEAPENNIDLDAFVLGVNRGLNQSYGMELANIRVYTAGVSPDALYADGPGATNGVPEPAFIGYFGATTNAITAGESTALSWAVFHSASSSIDQGIGDIAGFTFDGIGQTNVSPTNATTYTLTASNNTHGAVQATVTIDVLAPVPTIHAFTADDHYVSTGATVTLSWDVTNMTSLAITPNIGDVLAVTTNGVGQTNITLYTNTTYSLVAGNAAGMVTNSIDLYVGPPRPNVVLFLVDDMGITDTSVPFVYTNGTAALHNFNTNLYITPNMETLASRGMCFSAAYSQTVCSPTRTSLMTGLNAGGHGVTCWVNPGGTRIGGLSPNDYLMQGMTGNEETLPRWLGNAGYRTIHSGKAHFTYRYDPSKLDDEELPTFIGFDVNIAGSCNGQPGSYLGTANYASGSRPSWSIPGLEAYHGTDTFLTEACTIEANRAITESVNRGQPFFLYMSHYAVHAPFTTDTRVTNDYSSVSGGAQRFATMIEGMDLSLGDILSHLESLGIADDTLVMFIGDNGSDNPLNNHNTVPDAPYDDFLLRGKKGGKWEGGSRVPLIVSWAKPDATNAFQQTTPVATNSVEHDIVACWDLPVTIMNAAGVDIPVPVHGHDLGGYMAGTPGDHRPQEILIYSPHARNGDTFANYRAGNWKLMYTWQDNTYRLYNLAADPTEQNDLASDPAQGARVWSMARAMKEQFEEEWGSLGPLWPTDGQGARPQQNVPLPIPTELAPTATVFVTR